jgi:hypothetical protein
MKGSWIATSADMNTYRCTCKYGKVSSACDVGEPKDPPPVLDGVRIMAYAGSMYARSGAAVREDCAGLRG